MNKILKEILGLAKADCDVLDYLITVRKQPQKDQTRNCDEIAEHFGINLTTVQRAVKKLFEKDLIIKKQINLKGGGYQFEYQAVGKLAMKDKLVYFADIEMQKIIKEVNELKEL